jgi:PAS domain S-box-containing protein
MCLEEKDAPDAAAERLRQSPALTEHGTREDASVPVTALTVNGDEASLRRLRQTERELRYQRQLTDTIAVHVPAGLVLTDAAGRVTFMNPAAEQMLGWKQEELLGKSLHDAVHPQHPDGRPFSPAECPLENATASNPGLEDHEDVFFRRDGTAVPVLCSRTAILTDGEITGAVLLVKDLTERRRAEEAEAAAES